MAAVRLSLAKKPIDHGGRSRLARPRGVIGAQFFEISIHRRGHMMAPHYRRTHCQFATPRRAVGEAPCGGAALLRVMRQHHLTGRTHDGVVVALRSNVRWCSDHLEIRSRDGQGVRVLFVIDACDCEIIGWRAVANAELSAEMVQPHDHIGGASLREKQNQPPS